MDQLDSCLTNATGMLPDTPSIPGVNELSELLWDRGVSTFWSAAVAQRSAQLMERMQMVS